MPIKLPLPAHRGLAAHVDGPLPEQSQPAPMSSRGHRWPYHAQKLLAAMCPGDYQEGR